MREVLFLWPDGWQNDNFCHCPIPMMLMPDAALITVQLEGAEFQMLKTYSGSPKGFVFSIACAQQYMPPSTVVALDMADLAASILAAGKVDNRGAWLKSGVYRSGGMRLLVPAHPHTHVTRDVAFHYILARPLKTLMLEAKQVLWEDKKKTLVPFYSGTFRDFEHNLKSICSRSEIEP